MGTTIMIRTVSLILICSPLLLLQASPVPPSDEATVVAQEHVTNVKEINILLNLPSDCSFVYDAIIKQLNDCKTGRDRGDPRLNLLNKGCLLRMDLKKYRSECELDSKVVLFPDRSANVEFPIEF